MIKDLPPEPLEFAFEDDSVESDDCDTQTYTVPEKSSEKLDLSSELSLGEPIESAPIITPGENFLVVDDEDDDLVISGIPVKPTAQTDLTQNLATETAAIITELEEKSEDLLADDEEFVAEASAPVVQATTEVVVPKNTNQAVVTKATKSKNKKKKKDSSSLLVKLVIGSVVLSLMGIVAVVNLFIFGNSSTQHETEINKVISNSASNVPTSASERQAEKKAKEVAASFIKISELSSGQVTGEYKFVYNQATNIGSFQLNGSLEKPKPLSIEEVGRKVAAPSWLKNIETQGYNFKNLTTNSKQSFSIPTRFYFETNGVSTRLIGTTEVTIVRDKADNITLDYTLNIPSSNKIVISQEQILGRITFSF